MGDEGRKRRKAGGGEGKGRGGRKGEERKEE